MLKYQSFISVLPKNYEFITFPASSNYRQVCLIAECGGNKDTKEDDQRYQAPCLNSEQENVCTTGYNMQYVKGYIPNTDFYDENKNNAKPFIYGEYLGCVPSNKIQNDRNADLDITFYTDNSASGQESEKKREYSNNNEKLISLNSNKFETYKDDSPLKLKSMPSAVSIMTNLYSVGDKKYAYTVNLQLVNSTNWNVTVLDNKGSFISNRVVTPLLHALLRGKVYTININMKYHNDSSNSEAEEKNYVFSFTY